MELLDNYVPDFTSILLGQKPLSSSNYSVVISESDANISANPLISLLVGFYIKNGVSVVLMSAENALIHYTAICKKMGLNLTSNENFYFCDAFYSPVKNLIKEELPLSENIPYTYGTSRCKNYFEMIPSTNKSFDFSSLIDHLNQYDSITKTEIQN